MDGASVLWVTPGGASRGTVEELRERVDVSLAERDSVEAAAETVDADAVDCLVTAYDLPDGTGVELVRRVRETAPDTGCILFADVDRETVLDDPAAPIVAEYVDRDAPDATERLAELVDVTVSQRTQTAYPLPDDEGERLDALDALTLGSPSLDRAYERVTALAVEHFDVDRAAVNVLAKDTQEVLACRGADWTTLPREDTVCTHAVLTDGVTVVEDTETDPRFRELDGLDEMGIRFYAGAPLVTDGLPVGTFCIYDEEPRTVSPGGERVLELLAAETMHWIELHSRLDEPGEGPR